MKSVLCGGLSGRFSAVAECATCSKNTSHVATRVLAERQRRQVPAFSLEGDVAPATEGDKGGLQALAGRISPHNKRDPRGPFYYVEMGGLVIEVHRVSYGVTRCHEGSFVSRLRSQSVIECHEVSAFGVPFCKKRAVSLHDSLMVKKVYYLKLPYQLQDRLAERPQACDAQQSQKPRKCG